MTILLVILNAIINVLFTSADPNLFGSKKKRRAKEDLSVEMRGHASNTQLEIDTLETQNPFESAAAKSAMATSSRKAKQMQQRYANMMGGNNNPEALIAAQAATQEAVAGTAGDIAVGSEANQLAQVNQLRGLKANQMGAAWNAKQSSIEERGSGWSTLFQGLEAAGSVLEGIGSSIPLKF